MFDYGNVKTIEELLGIDKNFDEYFCSQTIKSHSEANWLLRVFSIFERMIDACVVELFVNQQNNVQDLGVLKSLRDEIVIKYFQRNPRNFLALLQKAIKKSTKSLKTIAHKDIDLEKNEILNRAKKLRDIIAHSADNYIDSKLEEIPLGSNIIVTKQEISNSLKKAIYVMYEIYSYIPTAELEDIREAMYPDSENPYD